MGTEEHFFTPPPEAPIYEPTWEEFQDPLAYIEKIRHVAEKAGICRIRPPPDWQPPFCVDVDRLKFVPRIQRLNELEAHTRIKLNFLDQIAKFWELQGSSLRLPVVEKKALDLYTLSKTVQEWGGMEKVTRDRRWTQVAMKMGFPGNKQGIGTLIKHNYERILYPYEVFLQGKAVTEFGKLGKDKETVDEKDEDYKPHKIPSRQAVAPPQDKDKIGRRSKRYGADSQDNGAGTSGTKVEVPPGVTEEEFENMRAGYKELKRLQFYGAGPKMAGYTTAKKEAQQKKTRGKKIIYDYDPLSKYICHNCLRGDGEESMLLCDGCDDSYHTYCLMPPLSSIPKGDWRCPKCVAEEVSKPTEAFGFEQAQKEYTLQSFGEMADQFKSDYFNMPVHLVPLELVEKEFWRIVSSIDEDVTVEYGADLHTMDHGSGFPTKNSLHLHPLYQEYVDCGWNLNNIPILEGSVLCHINADISGMKVPWMYVGMCFSAFCWHNEDHWSYSINYMHWGEPKTWYGIPGSKAEELEAAMKEAAPELFIHQPDLLHQLVTIMNPNILMKAGVPIYRTDQHAGEFVITFPRSYHAGFNQGYNFAEAVNFCTPDWMPIGRECVLHYSNLRRYCVFSHDELVCKMACDPENLPLTVAAATYQDMLKMVDQERKQRKSLLEWGVVKAEREAYELLPDDERQCEVCKTTIFLSAVSCPCTKEKLVCLRHYTSLCECNPAEHILRYRYTLDELPVMLRKLKTRAESFDTWAQNVKDALEAVGDTKIDLGELRQLLTQAEQCKFPESELLSMLIKAVQEADKCAAVAAQLASKKVRTRTRNAGEAKYRLTLEELQLFAEQIEQLSCHIKEGDAVKELLEKVKEFQEEAAKLLEEEMPESSLLQKCHDLGVTLDIELPELPLLKQKLEQASWLEEVQELMEDTDEVTLDGLRKLIDAGVSLPLHTAIESAMAELQELLTQSERLEERARICLQAKPRYSIQAAESIVKETHSLPANLPNMSALKDAVKKAKEWTLKAESLQESHQYPYLDDLDSVVNRGRSIPLKLDLISQLETDVGGAKSWKDKTARTFLKKNSVYSLLEILSPRTDVGDAVSKHRRRRLRDDQSAQQQQMMLLTLRQEELTDSVAIVDAFKKSQQREMEAMKSLRIRNLEKRANDSGDAKYCICRRALSGFMLQCDLCKDWFHATCVPLPKTNISRTKPPIVQSAQAAREQKFLCPCCQRSRRPRLETVLSLVVSLQKLPIRLPEGEALQCLTERSMNWQDRARQALATDELASALGKLSVLSQKLVEAAAREKTEKIINAEILKAAGNPDLQQHFQNLNSGASLSDDGQSGKEETKPSDLELAAASDTRSDDTGGEEESISSLLPDVKVEDDSFSGDPSNFNNSEHAYSTASKTSGVKKHTRKAPLVPRSLEPPVLELTELAKAKLEELMMEGDLLEVSLDETQHIWSILQATKPHREDKFPEFEETESDSYPEKVLQPEEKKKKLKRRTSAPESTKPKKFKVKVDGQKTLKVKKPILNKAKTLSKERNKLGQPAKKKIKKLTPTTSNLNTSEGEEENYDEDCAADKCRKPSGRDINWVQCDGGCELWFHYVCLDLSSDDISEDEDFICPNCKQLHDPSGLVTPLLRKVKPEPEQESQPGFDALLSLATVATRTPTPPAVPVCSETSMEVDKTEDDKSSV